MRNKVHLLLLLAERQHLSFFDHINKEADVARHELAASHAAPHNNQFAS
ncbi:MAG: hypothetical protein QNJ32_23945 [Xenococcaceae cyanobacterium MO_167.B27]|nr:hypothetical protein [Xenococcaceae cyanobacterium MO_167.B27]